MAKCCAVLFFVAISPVALAGVCPSSGSAPIELEVGSARELIFYGVSQPNIMIERKTTNAVDKIVFKDWGGGRLQHSTTGNKTEVRIGSCSSSLPSSTSTLTNVNVARPSCSSFLPLVAICSVFRDAPVAALLGGALLLATQSEAQATCEQFVKVDIYSAASAASECPAPAPSPPWTAKQSIFDAPTADEMRKIAELFSTAGTLEDCVGGLRAKETAVKFSPAPLPKPNATAIKALFGSDSLATTKKTSDPSLWGGIMLTYISRIDIKWPEKAVALNYLDGNGANPGRYARVNIAYGQCATPYFVEYQVGPLDGDATDMTATKLASQPWGSRPREGNEMRALKTMVDIILNEPRMQQITTESFGGNHGIELNNHEPAPPGILADERKTQILINYKIDGTWRGKDLALVPLSFTIDNIDGDPSTWTANSFYYNKQGPFTIDELVSGYNAGTITKVTMPAEWHRTIQNDFFPTAGSRPRRPFANLAGPRTYMPEGNRYTISGRTAKWMDWEFHAGYNFRAGPSFHDIKFKGQRIAYEISLSDVLLSYSADDPVGGNVIFFDATFGNGEYRELMRGIDCPEHATYIDNYWWAAPGGAQDAKRATCIYEHWDGDPIWRRGGPLVTGVKNEQLSIRTVLTNGNYDYSCTFTFDLGGKIKVDLSSTGFLQTHWYDPAASAQNSMSYRIHNYTGGSLHDHTYGMKIDLDVGTSANSFQTLKYKWGDTLSAVNEGRNESNILEAKPSYLLWDKMRYVQTTTVDNENNAKMTVDPTNPGSWVFGDITKKNAWGNPKMYRLSLLDAHAVAGVPSDHVTMPAASFAKQMLAVTKYKESEESLSGFYDLNRLADPQVSLDSYINGESIVQQDLVAWVSLATLHYPTSENMPMTNRINHGIALEPWNFFDENPSMDMPNYLRMHPGENDQVIVDAKNTDEPSGAPCVPPSVDRAHEFAGVF
eukprot:TRINITY_DN9053_c0_g1_i2.p1 TRINITY_DN9053_c0_g1~~TRINITY_DN9053_c0_g1_i2.p1  ORF type:complete len:948 (+),score=134.45 TRINITY_DN9053_c0_g1_i2:77-2920(+)